MYAVAKEEQQNNNIKVVVRIRPLTQREFNCDGANIITLLNDTTLIFDAVPQDDAAGFDMHLKRKHMRVQQTPRNLVMAFDRVFNVNVNNDQIFVECIAPLVTDLLQGYNCSVFAYGATGTGKTFTVLGSSYTRGLILLAMNDLFNQLETNALKYEVSVSYLEIYNEQVINLLNRKGPLKVQENARGVSVKGLQLQSIKGVQELQAILLLGQTNRSQQATLKNSLSSRSHAIFQAHVRFTDRQTKSKRYAKLSMIDLAGSERAAVQQGCGSDQQVSASINKSLLALTNCINGLYERNRHVPYRDSNLTRLMKDSLGGNCKTLMIVTVSMSVLAYDDTYHSLLYASRTKHISHQPHQNLLEEPAHSSVEQYRQQYDALRNVNERLMHTNQVLLTEVAKLQHEHAGSDLAAWHRRIDSTYALAIETHEHVRSLQSRIKNLHFRHKLKENTDTYNRILQLTKTPSQLHMAKFTASVTSLANHIGRESAELQLWTRKLRHANQALEQLRAAIETQDGAEELRLYVRSKELELQNSRKNISIHHVSAINTELVQDAVKMRQALALACMILQQSYEHMKANRQLCPEMERSFEQLQQLMRTKSIRFQRDDYQRDVCRRLDFQEMEETLTSSRYALVVANDHDNGHSAANGDEDVVDCEPVRSGAGANYHDNHDDNMPSTSRVHLPTSRRR